MAPDARFHGTSREQMRASRPEYKDYSVIPSDPPPPHRTIDVQLERHGKTANHVKAIGALLLAVVLALAGFVAWVQARPSKEYVDKAETRATAVANEKTKQLQDLSEKVAVIDATVKLVKDEQDRRWNNLDTILRNNFGADTNNPAPPSFGPAAKRLGR